MAVVCHQEIDNFFTAPLKFTNLPTAPTRFYLARQNCRFFGGRFLLSTLRSLGAILAFFKKEARDIIKVTSCLWWACLVDKTKKEANE